MVKDKISNNEKLRELSRIRGLQKGAYRQGGFSRFSSFFILLFSFFFFLLGCDNTFIPQAEQMRGYGTFSLVIAGNDRQSRTILPVMDAEQFIGYKLEFTASANSAVSSFYCTPDNLTVGLEAGTYKLEVTAFSEYIDAVNNKAVAKGTLNNIVIGSGADATGEVTLKALGVTDSGTGIFSWGIGLPNDLSEAYMEIIPLVNGLEQSSGTETWFFTGGNGINSKDLDDLLELASGYYRVIFTLKRDIDTRSISWRETLHVYQNMESRFEYIFTDSHFTNNFTVTSGAEWDFALNHIRNGGNNQDYTITVIGDVPVTGTTSNSFGNVTGLNVVLQGSGKLYLISQGSIVRVADNQSLVIDDIGLEGLTNGKNGASQDNNTSVVYVNGSNTELTMQGSASVSGNTASGNGNGGGVYVSSGTFTMQGSASVTGNTTSNSGGGVYVSNGSFTMQGSTSVNGNTASTTTSDSNSGNGGGVYVSNGTFTMQDSASVYGNTASRTDNSSTSGNGGGVYVTGANTVFIMEGGTVYGSEASGVPAELANSSLISGGAALNVNNGTARYDDGILILPHTDGHINYTNITITGGSGIILSGTSTEQDPWLVSNSAEWNQARKNIISTTTENYYIKVTGNFEMPGTTTNTFGSRSGIEVNISGDKTISLTAGTTGRLLTIAANQNVVMHDLELEGHIGNNNSLVRISETNAALTMQGSASVSGNTSIGGNGGGVYVAGNNNTFIMQDNASVYNNTASGNSIIIAIGGGVSVSSNNTFIMQGNASIYGNTSNTTVSLVGGAGGGGVVAGINSTFTMRDNTSVYDNTASVPSGSSSSGNGGGVNVQGGTFTMQDNASVYDNTASVPSGSSSSGNGGGVYVQNNGTFTMQGNASVHGNIASRTGSNSNSGNGGGVYVTGANAVFIMEGGTVYGREAPGVPAGLANSSSGSGAALFVSSGTAIYGDGIFVLPHTDGQSNYTNNTITGGGGSGIILDGNGTEQDPWLVSNSAEWNQARRNIILTTTSNYYINITGNFEMLGTTTNTFGSRTGIVVNITGDKTISLATGTTGRLLAITTNQSVVMHDLVLEGHSGNNTSLVYINGTNAALTMQGNASVYGNTASSNNGGGVYVGGGIFTMQDSALVSGNTASGSSSGGGVYVNGANAVFIMEGGTVYGSEESGVPSGSANNSSISGAALFVSNGTARYYDGSFILPHTDGHGNYTNNTITGGGGSGIILNGTGNEHDPWLVSNFAEWNQARVNIISTNTGNYYINITAKFEMPGNTANTFGSRTGIVVNIIGDKTISLTVGTTGSFMAIAANQSVVMHDLGLEGHSGNNTSLVYINGTNAAFTMQGKASVYGNTASSNNGGGVSVVNGGTFTMQNSTSVHGNTATTNSGGGVSVSSGTFIMQDNASVYGNTASSLGGGGVFVGGTFTMQGNASVYGNTATMGGGVRIDSGTFTMQDSASVHGNTASGTSSYYFGNGGGVFVGGTFTMQGSASVHGNTASGTSSSTSGNGGGVCVRIGGTFTMRDSASVHGNTAAAFSGGGVYVASSNSDFRISSGIIYGNNEQGLDGDGNPLANTATGSGAALYVNSGTAQYGTFDIYDNWQSAGNLSTRDDTIEVLNGVLQ